jgi:hypothetical protein
MLMRMGHRLFDSAPHRGTAIALAGLLASLGAGGCLIGSRDFHPHEGTGGQGGPYGTGGSSGGMGGVGGAPSVCAATDTTSFKVTWSLIDLNQDPTTCAAAGAVTMDLDVLNVASNVTTHNSFSCSAMQGIGSPLAAGDYSIALRLRDATGALESEALGPRRYSITQGCLTDLGNVPMQVSQSITFTWSLEKLATGAALTCTQANASTLQLTVDGMTAVFPCSDGEATTPPLAPGGHAVSISVLDPQGAVLSTTGSPTTVTITAGKLTDLGNVIFDLN